MQRLLAAACLLLALPIAGVLGSWAGFDAEARALFVHQASTVLPDYLAASLMLAAGVAVGAALVGTATAAAVTLFEFPGRKALELLLLLPLAMPAYVLAYAATDLLQFSGPLQTQLRAWTGATGPLWPDVRGLPGAIVLFVLCLYPYVYLLARAALAERGVALIEAARMLGAGTWERIVLVALPMARPAILAGVALVLMETLADYGVGAYFGLTTVTTGIYKAWLVMQQPAAAAQLASLLLVGVAALIALERKARQRMRFVSGRRGPAHGADAGRRRLHGGAAAGAIAVCALPVLLGFVLPVGVLGRLAIAEWAQAAGTDVALPWDRFLQWSFTSLRLATIAAALAALLAFALGFARRLPRGGHPPRLLHAGAALVGLGYALPGPVIAVGILLLVGAAQQAWPDAGLGIALTGSAAGLVYAYLVRFSSVAVQTLDAGYARLPRSLDESARTMGVARARVFTELHWPLLRRSVAVAALLVFVDVMKELPATLVLRPFDSDTLAVVAYQLARDERLAEAALPSLAIVAVGLLPVLLLARRAA